MIQSQSADECCHQRLRHPGLPDPVCTLRDVAAGVGLSGAKTRVVTAASSAAVGGAADPRMRVQRATLSLAGLVHDEMRRADRPRRRLGGSSATSSARRPARATRWAPAPLSSRGMPLSSTARAMRSASPTWTSFKRTASRCIRTTPSRARRRTGAARARRFWPRARRSTCWRARTRSSRARTRWRAPTRNGRGLGSACSSPSWSRETVPSCRGGGDRAGARRGAAAVHRGCGGVRRLAGAQRCHRYGRRGALRRRSRKQAE